MMMKRTVIDRVGDDDINFFNKNQQKGDCFTMMTMMMIVL